MESMREFNRVMEREIAKGDCPLRLEKIEIKTAEYKKIATEEKLTEVLSYLLRVGKFREYATKTVNDNVYMDRKGKQPVFIRTRSIIERNRLYGTIRRYGKKLAGDFDAPFYLETVQCFFSLPKEDMVKYRYTHEGKKTYAFVLKDKYIKALYAHCLLSRKEVAVTADVTGLDELTTAKGRDADVITQAFKEFVKSNERKQGRESIRKKLERFKQYTSLNKKE